MNMSVVRVIGLLLTCVQDVSKDIVLWSVDCTHGFAV